MKIIEFLQKIGILRFGAAAGTYSGAKDTPDGLMTDVYKTPKENRPREDTDGQSA